MAIAKDITAMVNGVDLGNTFKSLGFEATQNELDSTPLGGSSRTYALGFKEGALSCEGFWAADGATADEIHDILATTFNAGTNSVITVSMGAVAVGGDALMLVGPTIKYGIPINNGDLIMATADIRATNGVNFGKFLMHSAQAAGTNNGASSDKGSASSNGGLFQVHLYNDDASDVDVKVQHSTDNSSWVDLTAVNNLSATRAYGSAEVAAGTTVNRYLRAVTTVTGGDTFLVSAAFARR